MSEVGGAMPMEELILRRRRIVRVVIVRVRVRVMRVMVRMVVRSIILICC